MKSALSQDPEYLRRSFSRRHPHRGVRFVCTNLAVGGAGAFAGGFMSIHTGKIPLDEISEQITTYLDGFDQILALYRRWSSQRVQEGSLANALNRVPERHKARIIESFRDRDPTVYQA